MAKPQYKVVAFSEITVLEFPIILGDNPACTSGAPIQLDWELARKETHEIEFYEFYNKRDGAQLKKTKKSKPSSKKNVAVKTRTIPVSERAQLLMRNGYSLEEIANAVMLVQQVQEQRKESIKASGFGDKMQSFLGATASLPVGVVKSLLKSVGVAKQKQQNSTARSA